MEISNIIIAPVVTEKATDNQAHGHYAFYVNPTATKVEIKQAIEKLYGVKVKSVRTQTLPKKVRLLARNRHLTKRANTKKALVQLEDKKPLDFNKLNFEK